MMLDVKFVGEVDAAEAAHAMLHKDYIILMGDSVEDLEHRYVHDVAPIVGRTDGAHNLVTSKLQPGDVLIVDNHPVTGELVFQRIR